MSLLDNFPHKATAKRRKRTTDGMGGFVDSFNEVVFTNKSCWRQPAGDQVVTWWSQRGVDITHNVYFSEDPKLDENCVLVMEDGWMYDVKSYADASAGLGVLIRLMVQKMKRFKE